MKTISVSTLNAYVQNVLDRDVVLKNISISGEISGFKQHSSGHMYFTLKDANAVIRSVMFKQNNILETWWGKGIYKLIDTCAVEASWNGYRHIVIFDPLFTQYTSVCINNYDIVRGTHA